MVPDHPGTGAVSAPARCGIGFGRGVGFREKDFELLVFHRLGFW